ncbi:hypothetical protein J4427_02570 [Candidatus Woesearchaeota archaeon]|nr:hypothetical protein [Candidatus Woesearchaeota archaeon]
MEITIKAIIEIAGFPEEHVKNTMNMVIENLGKEKGISILKKNIAPVEKVTQMWSNFAELELRISNFKELNDFCFNYMPSSIEIMDPIKLNINSNEVDDLLNDLLARLHNFTMFLKNLQAENIVLKREKEASGGEKKK